MKKYFLLFLLVIVMCFGKNIIVEAQAGNDYTNWKQNDPEWNQQEAWPASQYPNATIRRMSGAGCAVTSIAMLLRHYGVITSSDVNVFNPWICNETLKNAGAFNSAADLYWNLNNAYPGFVYQDQVGYSLPMLTSLYNRGYACMVKVNGSGGYDHFVAVRNVSGSTVSIMDPGSSATNLNAYSSKKLIIYWKVNGSVPQNPSYNPEGYFDEVEGGNGTIYIKGWAFDRSNLNSNLEIHVYVGGSSGSGRDIYRTSFVANKYRSDVNKVHPGSGEYHGFEETFSVPFTGTYPVYIYAINVGAGDNALLSNSPRYVTVRAQSCGTPNISFTDIVGGKELKITGGSADTINYTVRKDGVAVNQGSSAGSMTLNLSEVGDYTVTASASRTGYETSTEASGSISLSAVEAPSIEQSVTGNNMILNMKSGTSGASIYYTLSGNTPTVSSSKYAGAVAVDEEKIVKAIAVKSGYVNSEVSVSEVKLAAPNAPTALTLQGAGKVPVGDTISVSWNGNEMSSGYTASLYKDGKRINYVTTSGTTASFVLSDVGIYSIKVYASNFVGNSEDSTDTVRIQAMAPVTVRFLDWDGSIIKAQTVPYGHDASLPDDPERRGHTFMSWDNGDKIAAVEEDLDVTAVYRINTYSVRFYNASGIQVGSTQKVQFGGSAFSPEDELTDIPKGYIFAGWKVMESSNDSQGDYLSVDSDMKLQAVYLWENDELPVLSEITSATRNAETGNYNVAVKLINYPTQATTALLRVSLLTKAGKMVKSSKMEVELAADSTEEKNVTLKYNGTATVASVVVLGLNGNDLTGSAYSREVTKEVTVLSDMVWSDWTEWTTEEIRATEDMEVEKKTEYRYADKSTTTSASPNMSGWILYNQTTSWNNWGGWSGWTTAPQYGSDSKQVETRTEYRYYYFYCPVCGGREPLQGTSDCHRYTLTLANAVAEWFPTAYKDSNSSAYSYASYKRYTTSLGDGQIWNFSAGNLYSTAVGTKDSDSDAIVIRTAYRYRTRTQNTTYYYYKWNDWSNWSETAYTASDSRKVETRTMYRSHKKVPVYSELEGAEEEGEAHTVSGVLDIDADLEGKLATIMVYKGKNTDPNEDQIQYVGQTAVGKGNVYSFTFTPKADPTDISGDYTVCLGIQGSTGLINVAVIQAPKAVYTVKYVDHDGTELSVQEVSAGGNAEVPESPVKEGYTFLGWNANAINVQGNMTITALYAANEYTVIFLDSGNNTVSYQTYGYGEELEYPETPTADGRRFLGWDCALEGITEVTRNMVVNAVYEVEQFTVQFVDDCQKVISEQEVVYGQAAVPPSALDVEGKEFLGWSTAEEWWNVQKDMVVEPILAYIDTVNASSYYFEEDDKGVLFYLKNGTENAKIYYTLDGTVPDSSANLYTGEIYLDNIKTETVEDQEQLQYTLYRSADINVVAVCEGMNDSEMQTIKYRSEKTMPMYQELTLTLDVNGGEMLETSEISIDNILPVGSLPIPVREGYEFDGWYSGRTDGNLVTVDSILNQDTTVYAHWYKVNEEVHIHSVPYEIRNAKAATVFEEGYTGDKYCKECGELVESGEKIDKLTPLLVLSREAVTLKVNTSIKIEVLEIAAGDSVEKWESSNEGIASVDSEGNISAHDRAGAVIISATLASGLKRTVNVTVTESGKDPDHVHAYSREVKKEPTCTEVGIVLYQCSCGDSYAETIPAAGHNAEVLVKFAKDASCTADGYTGDTYCPDCGQMVQEGNRVPALGHSWDGGRVTKAASATKDGMKTYTCLRCSATRTEVIKATGTTQDIKPGKTPELKAGATIQDAATNGIYKVLGNRTTVEYIGPADITKASNVIPDVVTCQGVTCKVTSVAASAFKGNKYIKKVTIGSNVTSIGKNSFYGCIKLKTVVIGKGVTSISAKAFNGCKALKKITIKSTKLKKVGKNAFKGIHAKAVIKVPKAKLKAYQKLLKNKGQGKKVRIAK